ncbi:DsbA family protein [Natrononativus amylolyticus]|uniref:DsbA family protein n=1 Tax=Natrononativus amylolyticus TaxID=2963434 RepID=UPI0020CEB529|nr:thioredoxin domain-containing protein [Natrononativus amylolyticus]
MDDRTLRRSRPSSRRRVLALTAASVGSLAGCLGSSTEPDDEEWNASITPASGDDDATADSTDDASASDDDGTDDTGDTGFDQSADRQWHDEQYAVDYDHPVTQELGREPTLGGHPDETGALIVEFDDISCRVCAEFHRETFPALASNVIEPGHATYVVRNFPRTEEWATPATYALESVYARDTERFWDLRGYLYDRLSDLHTGNVLEVIEAYLADTDLDEAAVLEDVEREQYAETIDRNLEIRRETGVFNTPTFFLFIDGEFQTRLTGHQSGTVFERTLEL